MYPLIFILENRGVFITRDDNLKALGPTRSGPGETPDNIAWTMWTEGNLPPVTT
jgi:hypothetical protein